MAAGAHVGAQIKDYTAVGQRWKAETTRVSSTTHALDDTEIATITRWTDLGAPQAIRRTFPRRRPLPRWTSVAGTPDVVHSRPTLPPWPEGKDIYRNFVLPVDFTEDRYVSAMEFKPGNRAIVHHIVTYIDETGASVKKDGKETEPGYTSPRGNRNRRRKVGRGLGARPHATVHGVGPSR